MITLDIVSGPFFSSSCMTLTELNLFKAAFQSLCQAVLFSHVLLMTSWNFQSFLSLYISLDISLLTSLTVYELNLQTYLV